MGKFEILKTKQLVQHVRNVKEEVDKNVQSRFDDFVERNLQYKSITVCEMNGAYWVVDGNKFLRSLIKCGTKNVLCYNLGKLEPGELEFYRVLLNVHTTRLDFVGIAEMLSYSKSKGYSTNKISNKTGLDIKSTERYTKLLEFDWEQFLREQEEDPQNTFFDERQD